MQKVIELSILFVPVALAIWSSNREDGDEAVGWLIKRVGLFFLIWSTVGVRLYFLFQ